jgi:3-oxoacyl-[acyl-carrier protein] reductase
VLQLTSRPDASHFLANHLFSRLPFCMSLPFTSLRALVGGSTQGIGRAVAQLLAEQGCAVTLLARNEARLREAAAALPTPGDARHNYLVADFDDPSHLETIVQGYLVEHPEGFHILINNTGGPAGGPLLDAPVDALRIAFNQHIVCNHLLAQAVVPGMRAAGYGRIVNVISTSVKVPIAGLGVSNTIRGAVASWAKTLANELGPDGITVNNVLPGATVTQRHTSLIEKKVAETGKSTEAIEADMLKTIPARRFGQAEEVAAAVVFLASPAAGYVNGTSVPVDGGRTGAL